MSRRRFRDQLTLAGIHSYAGTRPWGRRYYRSRCSCGWPGLKCETKRGAINAWLSHAVRG